jgi:RecB family exonuclease
MNRPAFTASDADRVRQCPASSALPHVQRTTPANTGGRVMHRFLELASSAGPDEAIADAPAESREALDGMPLELYPLHLTAEVAVAYDVMSGEGRILAIGQGRAYADVRDTEVCGTADVAGADDDYVVVVDYKPPFMALPAPAQSGQMRLLALALARARGKDAARLAWVRYRTDGDPWWEHGKLDAFDLDEIAEEVKASWVAVVRARAVVAAGKESDVHTGEWCRYCPALPHCPAYRGLALELAGASPGLDQPLTPELAGAAWARLAEVKRVVGQVEGALRVYAEQEPLVLPDGSRLGYVETTREQMPDGDAVWSTLIERYGRDVADAAVSRSATKASIKAAIRAMAKATGGKFAPLERALHEELRAAGLLVAKESRTLKVLDE